MNVRLAVQIFSHSVAAVIDTAVETGQMKSNTAISTANFIKVIDDAFDAWNSRGFRTSKLCNKPLSDENSQAFDALTKAYEIMGAVLKIDKQGRFKKCPCFSGFQQTISAIQMIYANQKEKGYPFLLMERLTQDVLENQFSIYRQRGGYARNPSTLTFQAAFKADCVINLMNPPKTSSYEATNTINLIEATDVKNVIEATDTVNIIETNIF